MSHKRKFKAVEILLTEEERFRHLSLSMMGLIQWQENGDINIIMGSKAYNNLIEFEKEMISKYHIDITISLGKYENVATETLRKWVRDTLRKNI